MNFRDFLHRKKVTGRTFYRSGSFCVGDEPKSGLVRDLGDRLQSRDVPFGTSGDSADIARKESVCCSAARDSE